jgi:hypothetical protein
VYSCLLHATGCSRHWYCRFASADGCRDILFFSLLHVV